MGFVDSPENHHFQHYFFGKIQYKYQTTKLQVNLCAVSKFSGIVLFLKYDIIESMLEKWKRLIDKGTIIFSLPWYWLMYLPQSYKPK